MAPTKSAETPRRSRRFSRDTVDPAKLPRTPILKRRGPSKEEELVACANGLEAWLPRLEEDVLALEELPGVNIDEGLQRQARKLLDAVQRLQTTRKDLLRMHGWRPTKMGDNDDLDHRFLLALWTCGEMFAKADAAVEEAAEKSALRPIRLLQPTYLANGNGNGDPKGEGRGTGAQGALIETLQRKSGTGKHVRALLPKCPERKAKARTYGPSS